MTTTRSLLRLSFSLALVLLPLGSCTTQRLFAPRENLNGSGPTGLPAAVYTLPPPAQAQVRVWSDGADYADAATDTAGGEQVRLHIGFELENNGDTPLRLPADAVQVQAITSSPAATARLLPQGSESTAEVGPGGTARVDFLFAIDGGAAPRAVDGFEVHWRVDAGDQRYQQVTPFQPFFPEPRDYYWRDPWPWWGFGFGYHWHCR